MEYVRLEQSKACKQCGQIKLLSEFPIHKECTDRHSNQCKACKQQIARNRKAANPEYYKQKGRELRAKHHESRIEWQREWRKNNPERYREQARDLYWKNPEKFRKRSADFAKQYPEKVNSVNRRRKARLRNAKTSKYTEKQVLELYGAICHLCDLPIDLEAPRWTALKGWQNGLHIDHVVPISKNGDDTIENVRPSHGFCNLRKNANLYYGEAEK
jgi:hypothetical protein